MIAKTCFVVMPIAREGSDDHSHYKALYEELRFAIAPLGYTVTRADEVQKSGAITKDIILRLAQADLVVADLTNINPNVFYELGVRHSLRAHGTLMILDETRTGEIPFDLGAYRVIKFKGDLPGIGRLRSALASFVGGQLSGEVDPRDNPVHDWLPVLPANALESSTGTAEGELRERLARAQQKLREYEDIYGIGKTQADRRGFSPLDIVKAALQEANE